MISTLQGLEGYYEEGAWVTETSWGAGANDSATGTVPSIALGDLINASQSWLNGWSRMSGESYGRFYAAMLTNSWESLAH